MCVADTWTNNIDAREYAAFLRTLFDSVSVQKQVIGPDGKVMMIAYVWKDEVECAFDEAYAVEEQPAVVQEAVQAATAKDRAKVEMAAEPEASPGPKTDYRARAKKKSKEEEPVKEKEKKDK